MGGLVMMHDARLKGGLVVMYLLLSAPAALGLLGRHSGEYCSRVID
jgi:hypothetical protein